MTHTAPKLSDNAIARRYHVPGTVSPEAATALAQAYGLMSQSPSPTRPASLADWDEFNANTKPMFEALSTATADGLQVERIDDVIGGVKVLRLRGASFTPGNWRLVYTHGGAYTLFSARSTLMVPALIAAQSGCEVISIDYTLAPRGQWQQVTDEVIAVWRALLGTGTRPQSAAIFGDSAGGGLAAGSVLKMRDQGVPLPAALYLLSPWSDITATGDSLSTLADFDPALASDFLAWAADAYVDPDDQKHPYVSPVYGDYSKPFPPTLIQVGTREIFLSHAVRHYQAIRTGRHEAVLDVYEGMPHVHPALVPSAPEAKVAIERASEFLLARLER
ncbi:MAG TPA: alpha/beta hydrolase [Burkholderiaceae bacterium]|nr:alpha/beta hydrolase [Burkholderiaceae bacterium]